MPLFDYSLMLAWEFALANVGSTGAQFAGQNELDFESTTFPWSVNSGATAVTAMTQAYPDKGSGAPLVVRIQITTAVVGGTSVRFCLCFDTTTQVATGQGASSSQTIVMQTGDIAVASLTAGAYVPEIKIPDRHARFCNLNTYLIGTVTQGAYTAYVDIATGMRHR
jgi:hypothetical protein